MRSSPNGIGLIRRRRERELSLHDHALRKGHVSTQRRGLSVSQGGRTELNHAGTLISHFQPPELCKNTSLLFKPLNLWNVVKAIQPD